MFFWKLKYVALQRFPGLQITFSRPKGTCLFGTDHIRNFSFIENVCQILQPEGEQNSVPLFFLYTDMQYATYSRAI